MSSLVRPALSLFLLLSLLTGLIYPLLMTGIARGLFPAQAQGSLVTRGDTVVGSRLIGQAFTSPGYFWGRPSATGGWSNNALLSGGSNQGPLNPALVDAATARVAALRAADPDTTAPVPMELVTTSGSGLDPHISPAAARFQAGRVARARGLDFELVLALIARHTQGRDLGFLGEARINVLALNLALDAEAPRQSPPAGP
ncbi:MAG: potassium-transporting ATPase subunit KdpC [Gammaproteobacteria bacterium]